MWKIKINKIQTLTSVFIVGCLLAYVFFPTSGFFQYKTVPIIFLVLLPYLYNKYFLKKENIFNKVAIGNWKNNLILMLIGLIGAFLVAAILLGYTDILKHYLLSTAVKHDFGKFIIYELTGVAFTVAVYEIFFRGFVMTYFSRIFGKLAILIQLLFFILMMILVALPYWFYVVYLIFTPFAGWIAYKSDSMLYSFLGQLIFIIIFDASFIALTVK